MRYFYLSRNEIKNGNIVVYDTFNIEVPLEAYRTAPGKEDAIQFAGENIPNDIAYDSVGDMLYSQGARPSPYHKFTNGKWEVYDTQGYKQYCLQTIDEAKQQILEYGFDYKGHRQRCRDKDISYMVATATALDIAKRVLEINKTVHWYFEDNYKMQLDLQSIAKLMLLGTTFIQSVFDTENYFKTLADCTVVTKEQFEQKRKEIHSKLVQNN